MRILTPARVALLMLVTVGGLVAAYVAKGLNASDRPVTQIVVRDGPARTAPVGVEDPVRSEDPIPPEDSVRPEEREPRPLRVADGMRAVSISFDARSDFVDGRIAPGQHADVHLTPRAGDGPGGRVRGGMSVTLLKGVKVLAMDSAAAGEPQRGGHSVTLELTPRQANIVVLAEQYGPLKLSYNPEAVGETVVSVGSDDRATLDEILGWNRPIPKQSRPAPPSPPSNARGFVAESYRGTTRTLVRFGE